MFRSLRSRLLAMLTSVVVITVVTIGAVSADALRRTSQERLREELRLQARTLGAAPADRLAREVENLEQLTSAEVFFTGDGPAVEGATQISRGRRGANAVERPQGDTWAADFRHDGRDWAGYAVRVDGGELVVARPARDIAGGWRPLALRIAALSAGALVFAWLLGVALAYRITRPLQQLVHATQDIARGRYPDTALEGIPLDAEIGLLASSFREMALKLREVDSRDRQFLMSISHELRTPLTAINGHAQALEDGLADDVETRNRSLAVIRREASRLERLVEDIIDLAKLRSNRFNTVSEAVNLDELGEHLMAIFAERADESDVAVRGEFAPVQFHSDGQRILQILRNLVNNGLRYARTEVRIIGERVSNSIRLTVSNDGEPISVEMRERIFEPFVGSKREGGMGLGLAIGRELAWALGGNLRIVPSDDGAVFELTLPLEPPGSGR